MIYHQTRFGSKEISSEDIAEAVIYWLYTSPTCDLDLTDSNPRDFQMTPCFKMMHHCNKFGYKTLSRSEDIFSGQSLDTKKHKQDRQTCDSSTPPIFVTGEGWGYNKRSLHSSLSLSHTHTHTHTHFCGCRNKCILGSQHFMSAQKENGVTDVLPKPAATWILNFPYLNKSTDKLGLSIWT